MHIENNDNNKLNDNMNVTSDTFNGIDEGDISNCIVNRDPMFDDSTVTSLQLQYN